MNDEMKEILGILKRCTYGNEVYLIKEHGATLLLDYITNLQQINNSLTTSLNKKIEEGINLQQERDKFKLRCFKAYKMIYDNYGVLDKYEIDLMEDILKGKDDK